MMPLRFTKMHGLGNDFMVIDAIHQKVALNAKTIAKLAKRDTGIGFDQCLLVEPSHEPEVDFFYRIFNADGSEVGQCGNGARCLMRFVYHYQLTEKKTIQVRTKTTQMQLVLNPDASVSIDVGRPEFRPEVIPLKVEAEAEAYVLPLQDGTGQRVHALSVGNPHAVSVVASLKEAKVLELGKAISQHPWFPEGANAGFMQILGADAIQLRVFERGAGETKACGSGAIAAAVAGMRFHHLDKHVQVFLPGGVLYVDWPGPGASVRLTGPAEFVYEGTLCASSS